MGDLEQTGERACRGAQKNSPLNERGGEKNLDCTVPTLSVFGYQALMRLGGCPG